MSMFGRIIIIHKNGKDGPTYFLRQRLCTIGKSRGCNIRMNLDEVADQHAWITVDSKNQVWIANSSEGKELKVNTRPVASGGKPAMLHHNSIIFIEGRAFRFEEESCLQDKPGSEGESPENIVVDNSPVKEKRPVQSTSLDQHNNPQSKIEQAAAPIPAARTKLSSGTERSSSGENSGGAKVGTKRTLSQSFDHVESSPSKRQRTDAMAVSRSAEIMTKESIAKPKLTMVREEKAADPAPQISPSKTNPLHKVRFLLPGQPTDSTSHKSSSSSSNAGNSMSAPTSPVKNKSGTSTRIQNFDDSQNESGSGAVWMRKMKKKLDDDEEEEDENGVTSSELDRISKGTTSPTKRGSKSPKKERAPKKEEKEKKKKASTPSTSPQKKRARSPSPDSRSSEEESEEEERKSSKKKSSSKDKKKDKKRSKDALQSKIRNIESSTIKSKSSKKRKNEDSDDESDKKSKSKRKNTKKSKSDEKDRHQKKRSLRVRRSKKKVDLSSEESVSSEEYDYNSQVESISSSSEEEAISSVSSSDDFQESPKKTKSSSPKKRKVKESFDSISEESDSSEKRKSKSKKRKLQVEPVKPTKQSTSANHSPTKTKKKEPSSDSDISGEVQQNSRQSEEEEATSRKEIRRESFKAFLKPLAHKKATEVVVMKEEIEEIEEKSEELDAPTSFPPNRPRTTQTYSKKDRAENFAKTTINLAPIKPHNPPPDLEEEFEEQIEEEDQQDDGSKFVQVGKKVQFSEKIASPIGSASASYSSHSQSQSGPMIPSFLETTNQGKSFVTVHGLPSQMTQRQSLYSPQLSQSPSSDQEDNAHAKKDEIVEAHGDKEDKMEVEQHEAAEVRSTPVPRQSQQGASMSLFSDAKEDEYDETNIDRNNNGQDKMEEDDDQSTLVVDRGDIKSQQVHNEEHEPSNTKSRDQSLTEIMEASTLIVDTVPDTPMQRQGSRSISKSKSSESVNTSLMSHEGNVSSAATNPLSLGSRSSNTAKLEENTHTTSTSIGAQTSAGSSYESLSIEEKIEFIKPKMKVEEVNSIEDLQKRVIVAFHELGCDEPQLLDDVIKAASELLPENYVANTPNWQNDLANAMMPLVSGLIISDVQYFVLRLQYRKSGQVNEREHEHFDEQEEEQNEQQIQNNFSFIPDKSASLNGGAINSNNKSHSSSSRSPSIPMQSIQSYESDQIANVASIPVNGGTKFSQHFEEQEEARDQMDEAKDHEDNMPEEEAANESQERDLDQEEQKLPSQTMSQNRVKLVNYSNSESVHNNHNNDQEPRPSPSDEENSEQEDEKNSEKIVSQQRISLKELETQHYSQNSKKGSSHSQGNRSGSQQSQTKLNESGSKVRSVANGPDQIRSELNKGMEILKSIVAKQKEPNAIRKWKRELNIKLRGNYLLCGGLNDGEVRMLLQLLLDELPDVNLEFIVSKLFSTAVVTIMVARNPGTKHEEIMQQVGQRCVALKVVGDHVADWQLTDVLNKEG